MTDSRYRQAWLIAPVSARVVDAGYPFKRGDQVTVIAEDDEYALITVSYNGTYVEAWVPLDLLSSTPERVSPSDELVREVATTILQTYYGDHAGEVYDVDLKVALAAIQAYEKGRS